jgi:hypothetical protein
VADISNAFAARDKLSIASGAGVCALDVTRAFTSADGGVGVGVGFKAVLSTTRDKPSIIGGSGGAGVESVVDVDDPNTFSARDELSIAGGSTGRVGMPSSIGSRGEQPLLVGGDALRLLMKDGFSNSLGLSVMICQAFEFGVVI